MRRTLLISAVSFVCGFPAFAAVPNDFDSDGISDRVRVEIGGDKSLTWKALLSGNQQTETLGTIGKEGDHLIMAQWLSGGSQIGVVSLSGSDDIVWSILNGAGEKLERTFGKKGDLVVAGGDFNGNGTADAAVVRLKGSKAEWQIRYDIFTSDTPNERSETFGKAGDRAFYASLDGTVDLIGVIRKGKGNRSMAQVKNLATGQVRKFLRLPKFASAGTRPRAFPIPQASGEDLLGFQLRKGNETEVRVYTLAGAEVTTAPFEGKGDSIVGQFAAGEGDRGFEVLFQGDSESGVLDPNKGEVTATSNLGGVPVDEININTMGAPTTADPGNGGGGGSSNGGGSVSQCSQTMGWPGSHIYKTVGSNHFTDIRRNTIGVILRMGARGPFPNCIEALDTSGRVIAKLGIYARGTGWAARYYAGIGCGAGTPFNGSRLASIARANTGSSRVYMSFGGVCYGPIEATQCIGSQQC
jgi:hypothetical protein